MDGQIETRSIECRPVALSIVPLRSRVHPGEWRRSHPIIADSFAPASFFPFLGPSVPHSPSTIAFLTNY